MHGGYDEMSEAERRRLAEVLGSLTGLQGGPMGVCQTGLIRIRSHLKGYRRSYASGERYPVTLVDGRFIREGERAVAHKTGIMGLPWERQPLAR